MKQAKRAITMVVFAVTVGCTNQLLTPTSPPVTAEVLSVYHTSDTQRLMSSIANEAPIENQDIRLEHHNGNHQQLLHLLNDNQINYFVSHHNPLISGEERWSAPLVQDGIALIVHPSNTIDNISIEQLQRIYRGFITDWSEIGGEDSNIVIYSRESGASLRLEFERLVMGQQQTSPNARVLSSSQLMLEQIENDPDGIGYIPISVLTENTKSLAIDTISPSIANLENNSYPLRSTIYVIGREEASDGYRQFFVRIQNMLPDDLRPYYVPLPR